MFYLIALNCKLKLKLFDFIYIYFKGPIFPLFDREEFFCVLYHFKLNIFHFFVFVCGKFESFDVTLVIVGVYLTIL